MQSKGVSCAFLLVALAISSGLSQQNPPSEDLGAAKADFDQGVDAFRRGNEPAAKAAWEKASAIYERLAPKSLDLAKCYSLLATALNDLGNLDSAEKYGEKALHILSEQNADAHIFAQTYSALGSIAESRGDLGASEKWFQKFLDLSTKEHPDSTVLTVGYNKLGSISWRRGDFDQAESLYRKALAIDLAEFPNSSFLTDTYNNLGNLEEQRGHLTQAEDWFRKDLEITEKSKPNSLDLTSVYNNLGLVAFDRGDLEAAQAWHLKALKIREIQAPDSLYLASTYNNLGMVAAVRGDLTTAKEYYKKALTIKMAKAPKSRTTSVTLSNLARLSKQEGDLSAAEGYFVRVLDLDQSSAPGSINVARDYIDLGGIAETRGDLASAKNRFLQALPVLQSKAPGSLILASNFLNLGGVSRSSGDLDEADRWYQKASAIVSTVAPNSLDLVDVLNAESDLAWNRGDLKSAKSFSMQSLKIASQKAPNSLSVAGVYNDLGLNAKSEGDYFAARNWYEQAIEIYLKRAPNSLGLAGTYNNLGVVFMRLEDLSRANEQYRKALTIYSTQAPVSLNIAEIYNNLGTLALVRQDFDEAVNWHGKALTIREAKAPNSMDLAATYSNLADVLTDRGELDSAEELAKKSLTIRTKKAPGSLELAISYEGLAEIARLKKDYQAAKNYFKLEAETVESQRSQILAPDSRALLSRTTEHSAPDYLDTLVRLHEDDSAVGLLESSKSRGVEESLFSRDAELDSPKLTSLKRDLRQRYLILGQEGSESKRAEIQTQIQDLQAQMRTAENEARASNPKLAALTYAPTLDLKKIQAAAGADTLVLHYLVGEQFTYLAAITSPSAVQNAKGIEFHRISISRKELEGKCDAFTKFVSGRSTRGRRSVDVEQPAGAVDDGRDLYRLLIQPLGEVIRKGRFKRLVICPNGPLNSVPFAALPDGKGGFLVDVLPITTVPSISTLIQIRSENRVHPTMRMLAMGDPLYSGQSASQSTRQARGLRLSPLPNTRSEAEAIAAFYGTTPLLGREATVSSFKKKSVSARYIHLACHGLLDSQEPMASSLALTPEKGDSGFLQANDVFNGSRLSADLVTLSACQTGLGKTEGNEGVNGMVRAFQYAGAKSVVVSLWSVDDKSTSLLMKEFYRSLKAGSEKDVALRSAELKLRRTYKNPFYWAPFTLSGDWK